MTHLPLILHLHLHLGSSISTAVAPVAAIYPVVSDPTLWTTTDIICTRGL